DFVVTISHFTARIRAWAISWNIQRPLLRGASTGLASLCSFILLGPGYRPRITQNKEKPGHERPQAMADGIAKQCTRPTKIFEAENDPDAPKNKAHKAASEFIDRHRSCHRMMIESLLA
ncbi:hypothetical protein N9Y81_01340, partial [Akkermansiaceae bacterium]|nr:hypothetical protein [Akkermansiaceae bacterium]